MNNFRILSIHIFNFKGFKDWTLDFSSYLFSIFGGKNGFGKTTIFDAIELVLTGKIERLCTYKKNTDKRYKNVGKPLVYNLSINTLYVELLVELQNGAFWLKREAKIVDMKNPVDFSVFSNLYIKPNYPDSKYEICNIPDLLPDSIVNRYGFLHYLDQEECTGFLKKSEKDRNELVCKLFNTKSFEDDLIKANKCKDILSEFNKVNSIHLLNLHERLKSFQEVHNFEFNGEIVKYIPLTYKQEGWDSKTPNLIFEQYIDLLSEQGLLNNIKYYIINKFEYTKYKTNAYINQFLVDENLNILAQFVYFNQRKDEVLLFREYKFYLENLFQEFKISDFNEFYIDKYISLSKFIPEHVLSTLSKKVSVIKEFYKSCSSSQQAYAQLMMQRDTLISFFNELDLNDKNKCPLCGHSYVSHDSLMNEIVKQEKVLKELSGKLSETLNAMFCDLKIYYSTNILTPIESIIRNESLSQDVVNSIENNDVAKFVDVIEHTMKVKFKPQETLTETKNFCHNLLISLVQNYDVNIDYKRLDMFNAEYGETLIKDNLTLANLEVKRSYIISKYKEYSSKEISEISNKLKKYQSINIYCEKKLKNLNKIIKQIKTQKEAYISKLISDIEILFYIYSGRIMQDNYYGRGIFMKNDDLKRVLFVSGDYKSDVDVLYNMSSGQLTSIILAFTLSLNKLYANSKFMAIDDPVQTMDDMNLWGFIETLRHEFNDYNVLLSTHENDYASLLRYKTSKMGIYSKFYNMSDFHIH